MLKIEFSPRAEKFLLKCEDKIYERILKKTKELSQNPYPSDCKRVEGRKEKVFRIRVGDYRIIYLIIKEENKLFISNVDKRGKIYK